MDQGCRSIFHVITIQTCQQGKIKEKLPRAPLFQTPNSVIKTTTLQRNRHAIKVASEPTAAALLNNNVYSALGRQAMRAASLLSVFEFPSLMDRERWATTPEKV